MQLTLLFELHESLLFVGHELHARFIERRNAAADGERPRLARSGNLFEDAFADHVLALEQRKRFLLRPAALID